MKKDNLLNRIVGTLLIVVFIFSVLQVLYVHIKMPKDSIFEQLDFRAADFSDGWYNTKTGAPILYDTLQNTLTIPAPGSAMVEIRKILTKPIPEGDYLSFRTYSESVHVIVNDQQIYVYEHTVTSAVSPAMYRMFCVQLPQLQKGDTIRIVFQNDERNTAYMQFMACGDVTSTYLFVFSEGYSALVTSLIALVVSVIALLLFIYYLFRRKKHMQLLYLSLFALLTASWIAIDSGLASMVVTRNIVQYYIRFICYMLMPATYLLFLQKAMNSNSKAFGVFALIDILVAMIALFLQQLNVLELSQVVMYLNVLLICSAVYTVAIAIQDRKVVNWIYMTVTVVYSVAVTGSIILYYTVGLLQGSLFFRYATSLIAIIMLICMMRNINAIEDQAEKAELYRKQKEDTESLMMLSQINSHFFNNTMNTIRGLIKFDADAAYKMTSDLSKYLRFRINAAGDESGISSFWDEMKAIRAYADICIVRYDNKLKVEYDIEIYDFKIPTLTVEPFVENAIRHGIFEGTGEGTVNVAAHYSENGFTVTVADNGRGFDVTELEKTESVGVRNVTKRMMQYPGCTVNIQSEIGKGTTVTLQYPENL